MMIMMMMMMMMMMMIIIIIIIIIIKKSVKSVRCVQIKLMVEMICGTCMLTLEP